MYSKLMYFPVVERGDTVNKDDPTLSHDLENVLDFAVHESAHIQLNIMYYNLGQIINALL